MTCEDFDDVQEEPERCSRERGKETRDFPEDRKKKGKMGIMESVQQQGNL